MVMMVVMTVPVAGNHDHPRRVAAVVAMVVMMMVVMMVMVELRELNVLARRSGFVDGLQRRRCIRDRLQQLRERICLQDVCRGGRALGGTDSAERCDGAQ